MEMIGSNRKSRVSSEVGVDRISNLPNNILSQILSFLPTKYAVLTSVLSSNWKSQWRAIENIDIDYDHSLRDCDTFKAYGFSLNLTRFMRFIVNVLGHCDSTNFHKFRLRCHHFISLSCLDDCVSFTLSHNVQELDLDIRTGVFYMLPRELFTCKSLKVLKVRVDNFIHVPPLIECLPNLKVLHIRFKSPMATSSERLFRNCPQLEDLLIEFRHELTRDMNFNIFAPLLRRLEIVAPVTSDFKVNYWFEVFAPELERFYIRDDPMACILSGSFPYLNRAALDIGTVELSETNFNKGDFAFQRVNEVVNVKYLSLSLHTTTVMSGIFFEYEESLCFPNLVVLEITTYDFKVRKLLPNFLKASPNLQYLILQVVKNEEPLKHYSQPLNWDAWVGEAPVKLVRHLKLIRIKLFHGLFVERNVIRFLLGNAKRLQKMLIYAAESDIKDKFSKSILKFPRASSTCRVDFV